MANYEGKFYMEYVLKYIKYYVFRIFNNEKVDQFTAYANNLKCPFSAEKMAKIGGFPTLSIYHKDQ